MSIEVKAKRIIRITTGESVPVPNLVNQRDPYRFSIIERPDIPIINRESVAANGVRPIRAIPRMPLGANLKENREIISRYSGSINITNTTDDMYWDIAFVFHYFFRTSVNEVLQFIDIKTHRITTTGDGNTYDLPLSTFSGVRKFVDGEEIRFVDSGVLPISRRDIEESTIEIQLDINLSHGSNTAKPLTANFTDVQAWYYQLADSLGNVVNDY